MLVLGIKLMTYARTRHTFTHPYAFSPVPSVYYVLSVIDLVWKNKHVSGLFYNMIYNYNHFLTKGVVLCDYMNTLLYVYTTFSLPIYQ